MKRAVFASETELAARVVAWLRTEGWDVYQEVLAGAVCDIVARRGPVLWAIECKLVFGTKVLEQAMDWIGQAHLVSAATPLTHGSRVLRDFCEWKGIGWLAVHADSLEPNVQEKIAPVLRRQVGKRLAGSLVEEQRLGECLAGSAGGGYHTPFRATCKRVREAVEAEPGISLGKLLAEVTTHYASKAGARSGIVYWADRGRIPGVEVRRDGKLLRLYPAGAQGKQTGLFPEQTSDMDH